MSDVPLKTWNQIMREIWAPTVAFLYPELVEEFGVDNVIDALNRVPLSEDEEGWR